MCCNISRQCCRLMLLVLGVIASSQVSAQTYENHEIVNVYIDELVSTRQFKRDELKTWFASAEKKQSILDAISRPAEKTKLWKDYRKIFVTESRISKGLIFWQQKQII